ncbi:MAG: hypothetical protein ACTHY0_02230 [Mammaliicoccus vitulinus]
MNEENKKVKMLRIIFLGIFCLLFTATTIAQYIKSDDAFVKIFLICVTFALFGFLKKEIYEYLNETDETN